MRDRVVLRVIKLLLPRAWSLAGAVLCALASVALTLLCPVLIGQAVDLIVGPGAVNFSGMLPILAWLVLSLSGAAIAGFLMARLINLITYRTVCSLRAEVFCRLGRVPISEIDKSSHGDIISRVVNDMDQLSDGLLHSFSQLLTGVITIFGTLLFMLSVNTGITLAVVLITPLSFLVASFIAKKSFRAFREQAASRGELSGYVQEMLGSQRLVKAFGYEKTAEQKFDEINERLRESGVKSQFYSSLTNPCTRFVNGVVYAAVGIFGAVAALSGALTVGQLSCFLSYANQYTKPFNEISGVVAELQSAIASARRVFALLDLPQERDEENAETLSECEGQVELRDVSFSYSPERTLIEHLSLLVRPGCHVAIVGPTGCGKTTIINLLMRFYDVNSGAVLVQGRDIRSLTRASLRSMYGMVLQETWLFRGTVRENIAYGRPSATLEEIKAAAHAAHAAGFIARLPRGYDTMLSQDGENLSQGQRQLICIARVMLSPPPMLILDEATSSIDTRTEALIQGAFQRLSAGKTSFVVAHRLSTIRSADVILVMKAGLVVEQGTHEELLRQGGFYSELYNSQFEIVN